MLLPMMGFLFTLVVAGLCVGLVMPFFRSTEQLTDMCEEDPESAWNVIHEIIISDQSDKILASVGAGPFEDLMAKHGAQFISRVELCARLDKAFRRMLGTVWKNQMADDVWDRIRKMAPPSW